MHDGPGVRTTVFLAGCPLSCAWCHNPEMRPASPLLLFFRRKCVSCGACAAVCPAGVHTVANGEHKIDRASCTACGACVGACPAEALAFSFRRMSVGEIMSVVLRDRAFYGERGGMTLSGGEPLAQPRGAMALLRACREAGISTAVETCGHFDPAILPELVPLVDTFLWDVKDTDGERHRRFTGVGNELILENLRRADALGAAIRLRCILVAGVNDGDDRLAATSRLRDSLAGCVGVDVLPYHSFGDAKAEFAGLPRDAHPEWIPGEDAVRHARKSL